jgi:hypothetical protein
MAEIAGRQTRNEMNRLKISHPSGQCDICGERVSKVYKRSTSDIRFGKCCEAEESIAERLLTFCVKKLGFRHPQPGEML